MIAHVCPHCGAPVTLGPAPRDYPELCPHCNQFFVALEPENSGANAGESASLYAIPPAPRTSRLATLSAVLGVLSFAFLGPLCSIPAIVTGHLARREFRRNPRAFDGGAPSTSGLWLGYLNLVFVVFFVIVIWPSLQVAKHSARRAACQGNLKQFGLAFQRFAHDDPNGWFPEASHRPGRLMFLNQADGMNSVYPAYLSSFTPLACPSDGRALKAAKKTPPDPQDTIDAGSYIYLGYVVTNDREMRAFAEAYKKRVAEGGRFDTDLEVPPGSGTGGGAKILRLREGVQRFLITDINGPPVDAAMRATIPIMWDRCRYDPKTDSWKWFNHKPGGANVLFMDGHVEFVNYPGRFPITGEACRILNELDALKSE